jgi:hypothetical protein
VIRVDAGLQGVTGIGYLGTMTHQLMLQVCSRASSLFFSQTSWHNYVILMTAPTILPTVYQLLLESSFLVLEKEPYSVSGTVFMA